MLRAVYGDPRAAAELVPRLTDRQAAGVDPLPTEPADLAPSLLRERRAEIRELPDATRLLLLLAAADQYPVPTDAFLRAVMAARLDTRCLDAAETAGIAHAGAGGVVFRDAWTRIAAYETGSPADRRDVHRLLARVLRDKREAPWRSWHRGAGALGPSGRLAAELGAAAGRAGDAGRLALARALAERAAALCPDQAERPRLVARAAAYAWRSGDGDRARRLAATVADDALSGVLALRAGNASEAFDALLTAVVQVGADAGGVGGAAPSGPSAPNTGYTEAGGSAVAGLRSTGVAVDGGCRSTVAEWGGGVRVSAAAGDVGCSSPRGAGDDRASGASGATGRTGARAAPALGGGDVLGAGVPTADEGDGGAASPGTDGRLNPLGARGTARPATTIPHTMDPAASPPAADAAFAAASDTAAISAPARASAVVAASAPAAHLLARVTEAAIYTGEVRRLREAVRVADRLGVVAPGTLTGLVAAFDGRYEDARDLLKAAAGRCGPGGDPTVLIHAGIAALLLGDHTRAATATVRAAASARARGTPVTVAQAMEFRAYADFWTGRPRAGEAAATDALWQAHATGQDNGACHLQAALAMFAALTADADVCRERAATARSYALAHGLGLPAALAQ